MGQYITQCLPSSGETSAQQSSSPFIPIDAKNNSSKGIHEIKERPERNQENIVSKELKKKLFNEQQIQKNFNNKKNENILDDNNNNNDLQQDHSPKKNTSQTAIDSPTLTTQTTHNNNNNEVDEWAEWDDEPQNQPNQNHSQINNQMISEFDPTPKQKYVEKIEGNYNPEEEKQEEEEEEEEDYFADLTPNIKINQKVLITPDKKIQQPLTKQTKSKFDIGVEEEGNWGEDVDIDI